MNGMTTKRSSAIRLLFVLIYSLVAIIPASSQIDTEFWCSVPHVVADSCQINVWLNTARMGTTDIPEIRFPAMNNQLFFTTDPWMFQYTDGHTHIGYGISCDDSVGMFPEDISYYPNTITPFDSISNNGFFTHTDHVIQAHLAVTARNSETTSLKGQKALGKRFLIPWQCLFPNLPDFPEARNSAQVIATEDGTTATIIPSVDLYGGHPAGVPFNVQLNRGQVYCFAAASQSAEGHLGGSEIHSDKPVVVEVADNAVTPDGTQTDMLLEQLLPEEYADREYIVIPAPAAALFATTAPLEEYAFIYAIENNTEIEILHGNQTQTVSLNRGDCHTFVFPNRTPAHIRSDKPFFVFQISGFGGNLCGSLLSPWQCRGIDDLEYKVMHKAYGDNTPLRKHLIFTFICEDNARNGFTTHLYHIDNWERPRCITFTLDPSSWSMIPGTNLWYCVKDITSNSVYNDIWKCIHVTNDDGPFQATVMEYDMPTLYTVKGTSAVHYADFDIACKLHFDTIAMQSEYCEGEDILFAFDTAKITGLQLFAPDHTPITGFLLNNVTISQSGYYYAMGYDASGCRAEPFTDSIFINITPSVTVHIEDSVCVGQSYNGFGFHYSADLLTESGVLIDSLTITSSEGCDSILILHLNVQQTSVEIVSSDGDFCDKGELALTAVSPADDYLWNTGETTPVIIANQTGRYSVTVTDGDCEASAYVDMPACDFQLLLPNAITPYNADGLNDYFSIPESIQRNIMIFSIEIYNREGTLVFKSDRPDFRWYGEAVCIPGVYIYFIHLKTKDYRILDLKGQITVL